MSHLHRLLLPVLLAFIALFIPALVLAQECGEPSEHYLVDNFEIVTNVDPGLVWSRDGDDWDLNCDHFNCNNLDSSGLKATIRAPYFGTLHTGDTLYLLIQRHTFNNGTHLRGRLELSNGEIITGTWTALNTDWITVGVSSDNDNDQLAAIYLDATTFGSAFDESFTFLVDQSYFLSSCNVQPGVYLSCPLVQNADFSTADGWLLDGTAVITGGALTLGPADIAAQNLTLTANRTYNAVISATVVTGTIPLNVVLGTQSETLTITEPGLYTATFTTPSNLAGPIVYGLENDGSGTITLDYTCVSLQTGDGEQGECLAPTNGTFEDDSGWNWYRGAEWFYPGKYASLPLADYGMIGTSETYTMPTLADGEHLLLGFTARGLDDGGVVSGQITNGGSTVEFNYSTYEAEYSYEASLDTLAEETGVQLSFVNPGDVITDVLSTADVVMDNVCVFIADRGPNLPTPTDPDGITPFDPGLQGFTSCGDLDGIWAGFGVNMAQYRADYAAGTSVWDPLGWVPWLISAIFVTLASWACFFFAAFLNLIDLITYFLNSVMNIGNWLVRMWPLFVAWLSGWNDWLAGSLANIANAIGNTLAAWSNWIGDALWATSTTIGLTLAAASEWLGNSLASLSDSIAAFLSDWSNWIAESLANLSDWIGATLATLWDWLASYFLSLNGLRIVINWLITAWNAFLAVLGSVISGILETLIGIWNDSLWPFLSEAWAWISGMPATIVGLLIDFIGAAWELLKMMFLWLWENVISVAHTPLTFYYAFDSGINADPYGLVSCSGENFWCTFLSGVQLINQLIAHSTLYPIIIVGIILSTLWILWDNFRELFFSPIEIR